jgi:hypothetical protein
MGLRNSRNNDLEKWFVLNSQIARLPAKVKPVKAGDAKLWAYIIHKNDRAARLLKEQPQRELRDAKSWIYGIREKTI